MTWTTDNRWGTGSNRMRVPDDAPAAYGARWIDQGDDTWADILPDRQGFAYNDAKDRDRLVELLIRNDNTLRIPGDLPHDRTDAWADLDNRWMVLRRRAGGYIYVDAWLHPETKETT